MFHNLPDSVFGKSRNKFSSILKFTSRWVTGYVTFSWSALSLSIPPLPPKQKCILSNKALSGRLLIALTKNLYTTERFPAWSLLEYSTV